MQFQGRKKTIHIFTVISEVTPCQTKSLVCLQSPAVLQSSPGGGRGVIQFPILEVRRWCRSCACVRTWVRIPPHCVAVRPVTSVLCGTLAEGSLELAAASLAPGSVRNPFLREWGGKFLCSLSCLNTPYVHTCICTCTHTYSMLNWLSSLLLMSYESKKKKTKKKKRCGEIHSHSENFHFLRKSQQLCYFGYCVTHYALKLCQPA